METRVRETINGQEEAQVNKGMEYYGQDLITRSFPTAPGGPAFDFGESKITRKKK